MCPNIQLIWLSNAQLAVRHEMKVYIVLVPCHGCFSNSWAFSDYINFMLGHIRRKDNN